MPPQTDAALPIRLLSVNQSFVGRKLRLAGRLLSYDVLSGLILLLDRDLAVLVDVSLCIDSWSSDWARERLGIIMVIGHLESSLTPLPIPVIPAYARAPAVDPDLVLRALLVIPAADLDMELWNSAIKDGEA